MPKYLCSYAHDIACFTDFVVSAKNQQTAQRKIKRALRAGAFKNANPEPAWENGATNERVFVQGPATPYSTSVTLKELTGYKHVL